MLNSFCNNDRKRLRDQEDIQDDKENLKKFKDEVNPKSLQLRINAKEYEHALSWMVANPDLLKVQVLDPQVLLLLVSAEASQSANRLALELIRVNCVDTNFGNPLALTILKNQDDLTKALIANPSTNLNIFINNQFILNYLWGENKVELLLELIATGRMDLSYFSIAKRQLIANKAILENKYNGLLFEIFSKYDLKSFFGISQQNILKSTEMLLDLQMPRNRTLDEKNEMIQQTELRRQQKIDQISNNTNYINFMKGNVSEERGSLFCAGINYIKKTEVETTLFSDYDLEVYFYILIHSAVRPLRKRFTIYGDHWKTGEVRVNENNEVKIFLFDSVSVMAETEIDKLSNIFKDYNTKIYYPEISIQYDKVSCELFALNALVRLEKVGKYLPGCYNQDLFNYLDKNSKDEKSTNNLTVCRSTLPLYLMQEMQSKQLLTNYIPSRSEENQLPINKKGELPSAACSKHFKNVLFNAEKKEVNTKLETKIYRLIGNFSKLAIQNSTDVVLNKVKETTLESFIDRNYKKQ